MRIKLNSRKRWLHAGSQAADATYLCEIMVKALCK